MTLRAKLLTEFVGTFMFLTVIALVPGIGALGPIAVGFALMAMVYMGGHVSGAHYNPAVSFGLYLRRVISVETMIWYWLVQVLAGALAFGFGYLLSGRSTGLREGDGVLWISALAAEIVFTSALVMNVAATKQTAGNSFYGLAIGATVMVGAFVVGPISGGAFNPAVGLGATMSAAIFTHGSWSSIWLYIVGPMTGAAIAAAVHRMQTPRSATVPPERSERRHGSGD
jgi:aquaporin Z